MKLIAIVCALLFFCTIISCKKDNPTPVPTNFSLSNFQLDGKPLSFTYANTSLTPLMIITFSGPIDHLSAQTSIVLSNLAGTIPMTYSFSHGDSTITVQPTTALKYWSIYNLQILAGLESFSKKTKYGSNLEFRIVTQIDTSDKFPQISDDALLDSVQKRTIRYFYDFGYPACGMARERNSSGSTVTTGGSGFGLMAIVVGISRGFIPRSDGVARFAKVVGYLETADRFHGAWSHWTDGDTGKVVPFGDNDDGADLVETSYMAQGLITVRQYLTSSDTVGNNLINRITALYQAVEWDWFERCDPTCHKWLYWHWSPDKAWIINFAMQGYFEEQITYFMAEASTTHSISASIYNTGYGTNSNGSSIVTGNTYTYNGESHVLYLGYPSPLYWVQYSYLGLNPHFSDQYANYWDQNKNATLINHAYCAADPKHYGYSDSCWGLTASDNPSGYSAQSPNNDNGTITPTAALSSFPYAPDESLKALHFFYYTMGDRLWGPYGFYDAFNLYDGWTASSTLAIDQGPIVVMIENYRTQLLWNLFMSAPEVQAATTKLGFTIN